MESSLRRPLSTVTNGTKLPQMRAKASAPKSEEAPKLGATIKRKAEDTAPAAQKKAAPAKYVCPSSLSLSELFALLFPYIYICPSVFFHFHLSIYHSFLSALLHSRSLELISFAPFFHPHIFSFFPLCNKVYWSCSSCCKLCELLVIVIFSPFIIPILLGCPST